MPTASSDDRGARIPELDGLRGTAILLVIVCHYIAPASNHSLGFWPSRILNAFAAGWSGVDLFFVLSGFLIGGILLDARDSPHYFRTFYMRRFYRILPIYYSWTLLFAVAVLIAVNFFPGRLPVASADLLRLPVQIFFLQNIFIAMPHFQWIWFVVTWSLAVEEQFYLIAPPLIRFLSLRRLATALVFAIALAPLLRYLLFVAWNPPSYLSAFLTPCRADAFSWGMLLGIAWRQPRFREFLRTRPVVLQRTFLFLFFGVAILLWWLAHPLLNIVTITVGFSWLAIFYSATLLLAISQPDSSIARIMRWRPLRWLGGISYCVYILHDAFNYFAHGILLHADPQIYNLAGVAVTLLALVLTLAISALSWRYFESPLIRRGHNYSYYDSEPASIPAKIFPPPIEVDR